MIFLTILRAANRQPMAKMIVAGLDGPQKFNARMSKRFYVQRRSFDSIFELHKILGELENDSISFVIRGEPVPNCDLSQPVRRLKYRDGDEGPFFQDAAARWVCFDFDGIACPANIDPMSNPDAAISYLRRLLPPTFHNVTCSYQWSNGAGFDGWANLRAHLWFIIDRSINDDELRQWVYDARLPVDAALFNTVQPHFTARPLFVGMADPIPIRSNILLGIHNVAKIEISRPIDPHFERMRPSPIRSDVAKSVGARSQFIGSDDQILSYRRAGGPIGLLSALKEASR